VRAFVSVTDKPPQTKWANGSNFAFVVMQSIQNAT
jgi:hypothetical protein